MNDITKYIESGLLEMYVLGLTNPQETDEVNNLIKLYAEISIEIEAITEALKTYSAINSPLPNATVKTMVDAAIDYSERLKNGEVPTIVPLLSEVSKVEDYSQWLNRDDMFMPLDIDNLHAKLIGYTPQATTAILWVTQHTPPEIHTKEFEKFLIIEGTCDITIGETIHKLVAGDFLSIPLHIVHQVKVTSALPCKVILQRVAA